MPLTLLFRLQFMAFLHYFVWGAWYATLSTYLNSGLKFEGSQIRSEERRVGKECRL